MLVKFFRYYGNFLNNPDKPDHVVNWTGNIPRQNDLIKLNLYPAYGITGEIYLVKYVMFSDSSDDINLYLEDFDT